jgi:glycerol-3-phosphate acyltransferase PlsY
VAILAYGVVAVGAYLLGSLPTGFLVAKLMGVDIRTAGSGNIGATNAFRVLGRGPGAFVLIVDAVKGCLAVVFAAFGGPLLGGTPAEHTDYFQVVGGLSVILGHNYTCWLKFKGGKGIATSAGVVMTLLFKPFLVAFVVWLVVFALSRYVSLASIAAAVALPVATWFLDPRPLMFWVAVAMGTLAIYKHRGNIQRLRAGTENRIGARKPPGDARP